MPLSSAIIKPIVTEKSSSAQEKRQYTFLVRRNASKVAIKQEIKKAYGVEADSVRTMLVPKKTRTFGRGRELVKRPVIKKAIITLKDNKTIDPSKLKDSSKKK